ncbi:acyl-CoA synthetase [Nocardioides marmoribigeumensis]|uniref:Acyl-CoA synthetase (AMP-forming)/AMP-acid ligase II n=1 Tax=Nocardioides marmoribigeumensis TaxID=433649 RepID=A0ABU2C1J4_9ACTN|nr:acyl-CoA synthetase [Nocardioides marmoribigeumensis]MDR7364532.1 acyl-CoA synthetase (AMP-forming)/AMP-acid ligase II [Nocardioides marmoribigeumensis]
MALNIADLFEHAVDVVPDRGVIQMGDRVVTYAELEAEANRLAHFLASRGIGTGDHVGIYAKNSIEHVVALLAVFKVRAVAINVNYRYVEGELDYLFDNSDIVALLHERPYAPLVAATAPKHTRLTTIVAMPDPTEPDNQADLSSYAGLTWEQALEDQSAERDFGERSADDLYIVYTGGTTGFPKGVMWRHEDFWRVLGGGIDFMTGERLEEFDQAEKAKASDPMVMFPLSPLMHGGAQAALLMHLFAGQRTVLEPKFDAAGTWRAIERAGVQGIFMTGDAMARPLIEEYEAGDYDASSLFVVASSAAIFSRPVKERWMKAFPNAVFTDSIGASETGFSGTGMQDSDNIRGEGPVVTLGAETVVLDELNQVIDPTDVGKVGRVARSGSVPLGYYKDPEKSARTFLEVDGRRYSVPGDFARIEEGGKVTLLGRGSNCINTGGEKVYPEEVEMALKAHPDVYDALVVGVVDDKYGQAVTAVIQPRGEDHPSVAELRDFLRPMLSGYKLPRAVTYVPEIPRSATGKANYPKAKEIAVAAVVSTGSITDNATAGV